VNSTPIDLSGLLAIAAALGWASGLRLYAVVFVTGLAGYMGWVQLPAGLHVLQSPILLGVSALMCFIEFFADKIPGVDTLWDMVHTLVRIPAGAALLSGDVLFQGSVGRVDLPGGDWPTLLQSIDSLIAAYPDETTVYPGHMGVTTLGRERATNPFLRELAR